MSTRFAGTCSAFIIYNYNNPQIKQFVVSTLGKAVESCGWVYHTCESIPPGTLTLNAGVKAVLASHANIVVENDLDSDGLNKWLEHTAIRQVINSKNLDNSNIIPVVLFDRFDQPINYSLLNPAPSRLDITGVWTKINFYEEKSTVESLKGELRRVLCEISREVSPQEAYEFLGYSPNNPESHTDHKSQNIEREETETETAIISETEDCGVKGSILNNGTNTGDNDEPSDRHSSSVNRQQQDSTDSALQEETAFSTTDLHPFKPIEAIGYYISSSLLAKTALKLLVFLLCAFRLCEEFQHLDTNLGIMKVLSSIAFVTFVAFAIINATGELYARGQVRVRLDKEMITQLSSYMVGEYQLTRSSQVDHAMVISKCERFLSNSFRDNLLLVWSHSILLTAILWQSGHLNGSYHESWEVYGMMIRIIFSAVAMGVVRSYVVGYHYYGMLQIHVHRTKMVQRDSKHTAALSQEVCWVKDNCDRWALWTLLFIGILTAVAATEIKSNMRSSSARCSAWNCWGTILFLIFVELAANCPCRSKKCIAVVADLLALWQSVSTTDSPSYPPCFGSCLKLTEFHVLVLIALSLIAFQVISSLVISNWPLLTMRLIKHRIALSIVIIMLAIAVGSHFCH